MIKPQVAITIKQFTKQVSIKTTTINICLQQQKTLPVNEIEWTAAATVAAEAEEQKKQLCLQLDMQH